MFDVRDDLDPLGDCTKAGGGGGGGEWRIAGCFWDFIDTCISVVMEKVMWMIS